MCAQLLQGCFNGYLGRLKHLPDRNQWIVQIDEREVRMTSLIWYELLPAYGDQRPQVPGNEYPCVNRAATTQHFILFQRNLLYTAITRGKKLVSSRRLE